jgi:phospholipid/cholesterol/gamma-HCH transport system substrate-binding protein
MPSVLQVRWAKLRVVTVSSVALLILLVLVYLLTGGTLLEPKAHLFLYINDATGLGPDAPVRVDGIGVGVVDSVKFSGSKDPNRIIRVQMTIERERLASITEDSIAQISNDSFIGDKFVDVTTGKAPGHVPENGEMHFKAQPDLMRSVDLSDFERQLRAVDTTLADIEQGRSDFGQFVIGDQVYIAMRRRFTELHSALRKAVATNGQIGSLLYTDALFRQVETPILQLDQKIAALQSGQGEMGRFLRDPAQFQQLRGMLQGLQKAVADARNADFMQSSQSYEGLSATVASLARQVDEINTSRLLNESDVYEGINGAAREMQQNVKDFRENPRKYMRLKIF